jgi:hypothetical protein
VPAVLPGPRPRPWLLQPLPLGPLLLLQKLHGHRRFHPPPTAAADRRPHAGAASCFLAHLVSWMDFLPRARRSEANDLLSLVPGRATHARVSAPRSRGATRSGQPTRTKNANVQLASRAEILPRPTIHHRQAIDYPSRPCPLIRLV